ncbi:MAG TPA: ATP-binding protein [Acidimicrobiales bacterium]
MTADFVVTEVFPAELTTPAEARRFVVGALRAGGVEVDEAVPLVVSELVTNAVLHAGSSAQVEVRVANECVRIEVHDSTNDLPTVREPGPYTVTGRGLMLVDALSDRWGASPTAMGKVVWFEIDR